LEHYIRLATAKDKKMIMAMMKDHALFEGHKLKFSIQHQQLNSIETLPITIFVVQSNNKLIGYMSIIKQFSTWDMNWYLYLDCLYLADEARGQGIGLQLMEKLRYFAKECRITLIQWQTPKDNLPAIEFYQKLGTVKKEKQRFFWAV